MPKRYLFCIQVSPPLESPLWVGKKHQIYGIKKKWFWRTYFLGTLYCEDVVCFLPSWVWCKIALQHLARKGHPTRFFSGWSHVDRGVQNASMCNSSQERREFLEEKSMLSQEVPFPKHCFIQNYNVVWWKILTTHVRQLWIVSFCFRRCCKLAAGLSIPWSLEVQLATPSMRMYSHHGFIFP